MTTAGRGPGRRRDAQEQLALGAVRRLFDENRERVFFARQVEVLHEDDWFHWITNRAVNELVREGTIRTESRLLVGGQTAHLLWHRSYRYYKREANRVVALVEAYAEPNISAALGLHGELMVLEGFARRQFVMHGRNTATFGGHSWTATKHNLDFIFERDDVAYGVEVKNTLGYMDLGELRTKVALCRRIGVRPVFVVRMMPKSWANEVIAAGGFALMLKYQLYPWFERDLAQRVRNEFGLPVDTPRALADGTMDRFVRWHGKQVVDIRNPF